VNAQILKAVAETRWAIRPQVLARLVGQLAGDADLDEIREELGAGPARSPRTAGAVAVLPLYGVIRPKPTLLSLLFGSGSSLQSFRAMFREAVGDESIGSIVIEIDSPGGVVDLVPEVAAEIRQARGQKPIVAVANTYAASAAYWLASQADEVVVTPSGEVGSIGVFVAHEDWSKFDERLGIKTTLIAAGKYKTEGNPFEPLSEEAREAIQAEVDEFYGMFVADVAKGRGVTEASVRAGFAEGRMATAKAAKKLGMADRVETLEATIVRLARGGGRPRSATSADERDQEPLEATLGQRPADDEPGVQAEDDSSGLPPATDHDFDEEREEALLPGAERLLARRAIREAQRPADRSVPATT